jgi:hypothetical protein
MDTIIAYRVNGALVQIVTWDHDGTVAVFPEHEAAVIYADANPLFASGQVDYQIIELDEL